MKNVVNYYYNLFPNDIHQKDRKFYFEIDGIKYVFIHYQNNLTKLEKIQNIIEKLEYRRIIYNQIVKNNTNGILTYVGGIPYILIKINVINQNNIILSDIVDFYKYTNNVINDKVNLEALSHLWMDKVDYFEYQVSQFGIKYPIIRHSFNYFVGMAENAITLLNSIQKKEIAATISHYRVPINSNVSDLYNPLNFIIDSKVRDICEYLKEKMFFLNVQDEVNYYFNYNYFSNEEIILLLARILFPTYFFDVCEIILFDGNEEYLKKLVSKINIYETNIKFIYKFLRNKYQIPEIEWLLI